MKKRSLTKRTELQRLLSKRGLASRSKAAKLIKDGKVSVDGKPIRDPRAFVSVNAKIIVEGTESTATVSNQKILIAFHKPKGVVTTTSDEKGRKTVYDVLPKQYHHLHAVGRLDMATSGLLLFTNDSILANDLLDPKNKIPRTYVVRVRGKISDLKIAQILKGIKDQGEFLRASKIELLKTSHRESTILVTLTEGKNREIRRMFDALGDEVTYLKRISFGAIELLNLEVGQVREIPISSLSVKKPNQI